MLWREEYKMKEKDTKVGIITFHNAINYGALLQTYALQKSIINMDMKQK